MVVHDCFFENLSDRAMFSGICKKLVGAVHVVRPHHHIDPRGTSLDNVFVLLRQATTHDDATTVLGVFPCLEVAQGAVQLVVGVLTNTAGVQHHDIGIGIIVCPRHSIGLQEACDSFGVVFVHLTPKGANYIGLWALATHAVEATEPQRTTP